MICTPQVAASLHRPVTEHRHQLGLRSPSPIKGPRCSLKIAAVSKPKIIPLKKRSSRRKLSFGLLEALKKPPPPPEEDFLDRLWNPLKLDVLEDPETLEFAREVEQTHGRVAMVASLACIFVKDFSRALSVGSVFERDLFDIFEREVDDMAREVERSTTKFEGLLGAAGVDGAMITQTEHFFFYFWLALFVVAVLVQGVPEVLKLATGEREKGKTLKMKKVGRFSRQETQPGPFSWLSKEGGTGGVQGGGGEWDPLGLRARLSPEMREMAMSAASMTEMNNGRLAMVSIVASAVCEEVTGNLQLFNVLEFYETAGLFSAAVVTESYEEEIFEEVGSEVAKEVVGDVINLVQMVNDGMDAVGMDVTGST